MNKFIRFLNGGNTIAISGERDFTSFKALCKRVGLDCFSNLAEDKKYGSTYWDLYNIAQVNHCLINHCTILVEYQPYKGLTFGYRSYEQSKEWYGLKPWTVNEVRKELA